jgi:hypothetical protein
MPNRRVAGLCLHCRVLSLGSRRTKINGSHPALLTVRTAYATQPLLTLLDPPIEPASLGPRGRVHLDWWIYLPAICFGDPLQIIVAEVHI